MVQFSVLVTLRIWQFCSLKRITWPMVSRDSPDTENTITNEFSTNRLSVG